jgi:hypothetical protein
LDGRRIKNAKKPEPGLKRSASSDDAVKKTEPGLKRSASSDNAVKKPQPGLKRSASNNDAVKEPHAELRRSASKETQEDVKRHFQGIAILGFSLADPHLTQISDDLYMYTGISCKFLAIGDKAVLMTKTGVDSERQQYLKKNGRFAEAMVEAWTGALESKNRLLLIVKTEEDRDNMELKIKVGVKLSAKHASEFGMPAGAGVSIIDVVDVDGGLVTRELPSLLPGHRATRHSSDYNIKDLFDNANSTAVSPQAASAVKSLYWIILHEVIVHDWLKLSHNYNPSRGAYGYDYMRDDALNRLSSWRTTLGVPDRLGHTSIFDRQDAISGYLWLDPLRTYFSGAVDDTGNSTELNWWQGQSDPTEFETLAPTYGRAQRRGEKYQRSRLYSRFRDEIGKVNKALVVRFVVAV